LQVLSRLINREHEASERIKTRIEQSRRQLIVKYLHCGQLLQKAKALCYLRDENWLAWIKANLMIKPARVRHYIAFFHDYRCKHSLVTSESLHALHTLPDDEFEELWEAWQRISANRQSSQQAAARQTLRQIAAENPGRILHEAARIKAKRRQERLQARERQRARVLRLNHPLAGDDWQLLHGDFGTECEKIEPASVGLLLADPPYQKEFLPLYGQLSQVASRLLKPGGNCLVDTGLESLPEVLSLLTRHLTYQWTLCHGILAHPCRVNKPRVYQRWKAYVWLTNGENNWEYVSDWIRAFEADKRFHEWGKPVPVMAELIERFSVRGDLVLDPFVGGGATAVAAVNLKRLFIGIDKHEYAVKTAAERLASGERLPDSYSPSQGAEPLR
jgi:site-specific DNA-methyltransferase (adenine-specific)